jgi:nitrate reductase beta subunit
VRVEGEDSEGSETETCEAVQSFVEVGCDYADLFKRSEDRGQDWGWCHNACGYREVDKVSRQYCVLCARKWEIGLREVCYIVTVVIDMYTILGVIMFARHHVRASSCSSVTLP